MTKKKLSAEDSELFRNTVGKVKAIEPQNLHLPQPPKPVFRPRMTAPNERKTFSDDFAEGLENLGLEDTVSYLSPGLQKNLIRKLRSGYFEVDAELDLHGHTVQNSKQQLSRFLSHCLNKGYRCVHIIHGKGYRSQDQQPVLKNHLNHWLRQYPEVLGFCSAALKDGGAGALRVLLQSSEKHSFK